MDRHTVVYLDGKVGHFLADYVKNEGGTLVLRNTPTEPGTYPALVGMVAAGTWRSMSSRPARVSTRKKK